MKSKVCVWIDRKNAFLVFWGGEIQQLNSDQYLELSPINISASYSLGHFYDEVVAQIGQAEYVYIFGLSEAKKELQDRLALKRLTKLWRIFTANN
jgi:hypothetical protein